MGFAKRTSGTLWVWAAFMVCGIHQAVAGGDPPPSPAAPAQLLKTDTAVAAPAQTPASTSTTTEGATRVPAVVVKSTPDKSQEDPVLTNDEVKRLLSAGYSQEKTSNDVLYCRKEDHVGSMIAKKQCLTGTQLKAMAREKRDFNDGVQAKGGLNPRAPVRQ